MDGAFALTVYQFEHFLLDCRARLLFRVASDRGRIEVPLGSRAFALACVLVQGRGGIVSRSKIMDEVWPGVAVEENNLTVQLAALRRVLDESRPGPSCIQTVPRRGYRFALPVLEYAEAPHASPDPASVLQPPAKRSLGRWQRLVAAAV